MDIIKTNSLPTINKTGSDYFQKLHRADIFVYGEKQKFFGKIM
jgi:hypothetical protein